MKCSDDFRLDLLNLINDNRGLSRAGLLNLAGGNGRDTDAVIKNLIDEKLISYSGISYSLMLGERRVLLYRKSEIMRPSSRPTRMQRSVLLKQATGATSERIVSTISR